MAMASTDGQMEEPMKVNAKRIFFTEKENIHGLMAEATKVILLIRKTKDMAFIDKQMVKYMKVSGIKVNNMEKEKLLLLMDLQRWENGTMERK